MLPVDHAQRLAALDPLRSICVTAPAGSGKTELLSQRVLKLLARAQQPEEILAITFTRKAAAEMHHRIIAALQFALEHDEPEEGHKKLTWQLAKDALKQNDSLGWNLLSNTSRLKVQTIDSLCASLTRQMPILSAFGAQPKIADNAQPFYQAAVHSLLESLETNSPVADDLATLLVHVDNNFSKLERLLITLLSKRDQWLLHIGISHDPAVAKERLETVLQQVHRDVLTALHLKLLPIAPELLPLLDYAGCNLQWQKTDSIATVLAGIIELPNCHSSSVKEWQAIAELLLTKGDGWRKTVNKSTGFPTETIDGDKTLAKALKAKFIEVLGVVADCDGLQDKLIELRKLPAAEFSAGQWQILESLSRLLPMLVAELQLVFQQQGQVDYSQISMAALQALGDGLNPTELAMKLDYRLSQILVDEFQDTASTQFQLLQRLVEGWAEYNINNPETPNTLFIVGDGMQSIYGFRQANVGLFLEARKQGVNGLLLDDLPLTVNFRSDPAVVSWVNDTFSKSFPAEENLARGAVPFEHADAFNQARENSAIQVLGFSSEQARLDEAEKVVDIINQFQSSTPAGSIAILVRSRGHLLDIIPALQAAGIAWSATDIDALDSYSCIQDLLSLSKALSNLADNISWAALLRTPWLGLNNADIHSLLANEPSSVFIALTSAHQNNALSNHGQKRLAAVAAIFNAAITNRQRLPMRSWVEGVWMDLGGAACVASSDEFAIVDDFFDLLETHQQGEAVIAMSQFEQAVQQLYAKPIVSECNLSIMTIHKSKGLEFDCVILPGLARAGRSDDKELLLWREYLSTDDSHKSHGGLLISPLGASGDVEDLTYQHLRFEQAQSSQLENTRLLYVAATRAVSQLYCLFTVQPDAKTGEPKPPAKGSLLSNAWLALEEQVQWSQLNSVDNKDVTQFGLDFDSAENESSLLRLPADWQAPSMSSPNPLSDFYLDNTFDDLVDNTPELQPDMLPASIGTITHWVLEILAVQGLMFWRDMSQLEQQQWLEALLHHHQISNILWPTIIDRVVNHVNNTLDDEQGRWILDPTHVASRNELALLSNFAGLFKQKVIDRCFIDANHDVWIIDYKTSQPQSDESKEQFLQREASEYRAQLQDYKLHLSVYLPEMIAENKLELEPSQLSIRTALYFTHYPHWMELEL